MRWIRIGKILNINNPKGWVKVYIYNNVNIDKLINKSVALINNDEKYFEKITNLKKHQNKIFIIFNKNNIQNTNFLNKYIYIDQDNNENNDLIKPDLKSYKCFYKNQSIGKVIEINNYKSKDVLTISNNQNTKILLPIVEDFIEKIDHNKKIIYFKRIK